MNDGPQHMIVYYLTLFALVVLAELFAFPALAQTPALDLYPSPAPQFACGVIKLRSAYAGHAIRLQRTSDNAQSDFDFNPQNVVDDVAIQAWLGSSPGYLVKCYDQSGNGNDAPSHTVGTDAPLYKGVTATHLTGAQATPSIQEWLGFPSIDFWARNNGGAGAVVYMNLAAGVATNKTAVSMIAATTVNDLRANGVFQVLQSYMCVGTGTPLCWSNTNSLDAAWDQSTTPTGSIRPPSDWAVRGFTSGTANICDYVDNLSGCASSGFSGSAFTGGTLSSSRASPIESYDGDATAFIIWGSELTARQMTDRIEAVKGQLNLTGFQRNIIVCDGDSIGENTLAVYGEGHCRRLMSRIWADTGVRPRVYNVSIAGMGFAVGAHPLTSEFAAKTAPPLNSQTYARRIVYVMAGTNDIAGGADAATTSTRFTSYASTARSNTQGVKVAYGGILSRDPGQGGNDATCTSAMANIVSAASYDALSTWHSDSHMVCNGSNYANTTYFADGVHPTNVGHDLGAIDAAAAVEPFLLGEQGGLARRLLH